MTDPTNVTVHDEPNHRLHRIAHEMNKTFDTHPEHEDDDRCVVFLMDEHLGGIVIHGYADPTDALADLLVHLKAMFQAQGKDLAIMTLPERGVG